MSTYPVRLEARVSAQEKMQTILHAQIEEVAQDMAESFKQQVAYQVQFEQKVDARFDKVEAEIASIKATMATKEDMAALEKRMLDAFQQLLTMIERRLPPSEPK